MKTKGTRRKSRAFLQVTTVKIILIKTFIIVEARLTALSDFTLDSSADLEDSYLEPDVS